MAFFVSFEMINESMEDIYLPILNINIIITIAHDLMKPENARITLLRTPLRELADASRRAHKL